MASAFSEADGVDYTDPDEVKYFNIIRSVSNFIFSFAVPDFSVRET
jgi:hypothetical protein